MGLIEKIGPRFPEPVRATLRPAVAVYVARTSLVAPWLTRFRWKAKRATLRRYGVTLRKQPRHYLTYLLVDPELANFTYDLANEQELLTWLSSVTETPQARISELLAELREDQEFELLLRQELRRRRLYRKRRPMYGRRAGWYVVARLLTPRTIVETGIHDGLGSALLLRALSRNAAAGHSGRLVSVDINPAAGWLVPDSLRDRWTPVFASSPEALPGAVDGHDVEMFIHDSDHTYECERAEIEIALANRGHFLALVSDNSHVTTALRDVCAELGVEYGLFLEKPKGHFYPGAGIGFGMVR